MNQKQAQELILQSLEHEQGGVKVYTTALECAVNPDLKAEWQEYLEQTKLHVSALESVCSALGLDARQETPGRRVVRHVGTALVEAMKLALGGGDAIAAELVACECVVLAETKDHADWQLLGKCAEHLEGQAATLLKQAYAQIEDQEDEHLYHTKGWCRELWVQSLGLPAVLPPPEEQQQVKTAIGAARAEQLGEKLRLESQR
jgi:ferritin-like metal-binding protein YciE